MDLNADLGESFGVYRYGADAQLAAVVSSGNVACGFHAGDPDTMLATVRLLAAHGVAVGAHPGYPDLVGFGRRDLDVSPATAAADVIYQVGALTAVARLAGVRVRHLKLHGALYNRAAGDEALADAVAAALVPWRDELVWVVLAGSAMERAAVARGLRWAAEGFADRLYLADGRLAPRSQPGAVLTDTAQVAAQALALARGEPVVTADGGQLRLRVHTICLHGDTPAAAAHAAAVRQGLAAAGLTIRPLADFR